MASFEVLGQVRDATRLVECLSRADAEGLDSIPSTTEQSCMSVVPALRRWGKGAQKFKASPGCTRPALNKHTKLDVVAQACNSSTWKVEARGSGAHDHP